MVILSIEYKGQNLLTIEITERATSDLIKRGIMNQYGFMIVGNPREKGKMVVACLWAPFKILIQLMVACFGLQAFISGCAR